MYPEIGEQFYLILARPEDLDALWKEGWRHFGIWFFRYSIYRENDNLFRVVPLRINLNDFFFSKSQRKIWRRNSDLEIKIDLPFIDEQRRQFHSHPIIKSAGLFFI